MSIRRPMRLLASVGIPVVILGLGWGAVTMHQTYGIWWPLDPPTKLLLCGRDYAFAGPSVSEAEARSRDGQGLVLTLSATIGSRSVPRPDLAPTTPALLYGGCPATVLVSVGAGFLTYLPAAGGP